MTSSLPIGTSLKFTGYADSKEGITVSDEETVTISFEPHPDLSGYQPSYYIVADEGLSFNLRKEFPQCPNAGERLEFFTRSDWERLSCKLFDIRRNFIQNLEDCVIPPRLLLPGLYYLIDFEW